MRLDIRQESNVHSDAVADLLSHLGIDYPALSEKEKLNLLRVTLPQPLLWTPYILT